MSTHTYLIELTRTSAGQNGNRVTAAVYSAESGARVARKSACGGGYDLTSTAIAGAILSMHTVQAALRAAVNAENAETVTRNGRSTGRNRTSLYGSSIDLDTGAVDFYGACGLSSLRALLEFAGIHVAEIVKRGRVSGWFMTV